MSADQIKNSAVRRDRRFDGDLNSKLKEDTPNRVSLTLPAPDAATNPWTAGAPTNATLVCRLLGNGLASVSWAGLTGTADAAETMAWSGIVPASFRPSAAQVGVCHLTNNSVQAAGKVSLASNGTLTFATAAGAAFTASGTCAISEGSFVYEL